MSVSIETGVYFNIVMETSVAQEHLTNAVAVQLWLMLASSLALPEQVSRQTFGFPPDSSQFPPMTYVVRGKDQRQIKVCVKVLKSKMAPKFTSYN